MHLWPNSTHGFIARMVQAPIWSHDEFSKDGPLDLLLGVVGNAGSLMVEDAVWRPEDVEEKEPGEETHEEEAS